MNLNISKTTDEVILKLADYFVHVAGNYISINGRFTLALSGGSSPERLYKLLASADYNTKIDWKKIFFFFGDERYVHHTDKESNYRMAKEVLFDPLKIEAENIFALDTSLDPVSSASNYFNTITKFFDNNKPVFDLVLLGLGDDGHTASLFPGTTVLYDTVPAVKEVFLEHKNVYRITMNAPLINRASHIAFLVYGIGKAKAIQQLIEGATDLNKYPAQLIRPETGDVQCFLDNDAASHLHIC